LIVSFILQNKIRYLFGRKGWYIKGRILLSTWWLVARYGGGGQLTS
jgi:hypothetical protein